VSDASLPFLAVLEAVLAWQRDPREDRRVRVGEAIGAVVSQVGGRGAFLEADVTRLPGLTVGWGSLANGSGDRGAAQCIQLRAYDGAIGTGSLWLDGVDSLAPEAVRVIELAVEAAWARADARQTADRLEALDAATRGIAGLVSLERVLQDIADRVRELIGAQYAALGIVDEFGVIERFVTSGMSREQREAIGPLPRGHGLLGLIIRENRAYRIPEIGAHESSSGFPPNHPPMHSFLGVPIQVKGRSVGNFYLTNKRNAAEFSEADERLVEMFALHAGVAIENARLHEQVQRLAVVDERVRIGKDLHDGIIQAIYAVGLSLEDVPDLMTEDPGEATARVDRAIDSLNLTIRDIRNFIFGLRPELADQAGLVAGLAALANEFRLNSVIDVEIDAADDLPEVGAHRRGELLKIVREALSNIARHSKATRASIRVAEVDEGLELVISDNGTGFRVPQDRGPQHQGLANMRGRALDLGGALSITSAAGTGTRVIITVPAAPAPELTEIGTGGHG
jgi:signal transduction histidine kinase